MHLSPGDPGYPKRLAILGELQAPITVSAPLGDPERVVAIVGSRKPERGAREFARGLARALARAGVTIVSGGAAGVDRAAHDGAMEGGGATWVASPSGKRNPYPKEHAGFFAAIEGTPPHVMIWLFDEETRFEAERARSRNRLLVALADAVVVVQAGFRSGSLNAIRHARTLRKPLWIAPAAPWMGRHSGSLAQLRDGRARALWDVAELFRSLGLPPPSARDLSEETVALPAPGNDVEPDDFQELLIPAAGGPLTVDETAVLSATSSAPRHVDSIVEGSGLAISSVRSALLTLTMKNVVVEGPDGFFRRQMGG